MRVPRPRPPPGRGAALLAVALALSAAVAPVCADAFVGDSFALANKPDAAANAASSNEVAGNLAGGLLSNADGALGGVLSDLSSAVAAATSVAGSLAADATSVLGVAASDVSSVAADVTSLVGSVASAATADPTPVLGDVASAVDSAVNGVTSVLGGVTSDVGGVTSLVGGVTSLTAVVSELSSALSSVISEVSSVATAVVGTTTLSLPNIDTILTSLGADISTLLADTTTDTTTAAAPTIGASVDYHDFHDRYRYIHNDSVVHTPFGGGDGGGGGGGGGGSDAGGGDVTTVVIATDSGGNTITSTITTSETAVTAGQAAATATGGSGTSTTTSTSNTSSQSSTVVIAAVVGTVGFLVVGAVIGGVVWVRRRKAASPLQPPGYEAQPGGYTDVERSLGAGSTVMSSVDDSARGSAYQPVPQKGDSALFPSTNVQASVPTYATNGFNAPIFPKGGFGFFPPAFGSGLWAGYTPQGAVPPPAQSMLSASSETTAVNPTTSPFREQQTGAPAGAFDSSMASTPVVSVPAHSSEDQFQLVRIDSDGDAAPAADNADGVRQPNTPADGQARAVSVAATSEWAAGSDARMTVLSGADGGVGGSSGDLESRFGSVTSFYDVVRRGRDVDVAGDIMRMLREEEQ
ncbi:hypothetical protein HK405_015908 [Cladochytrium tenue]|nr:hypothetical protein HK405_015908 [Cladochytrium tenue]